MGCGWPFHNDKTCEECKAWEEKYGQNVDDWITTRNEVRAAARVVTRRTTPPTPNV